MRISDWSSDVCSSDLPENAIAHHHGATDEDAGDGRDQAHHLADAGDLDTGESELDVEGICHDAADGVAELVEKRKQQDDSPAAARPKVQQRCDHGLVEPRLWADRKRTRLNSSH